MRQARLRDAVATPAMDGRDRKPSDTSGRARTAESIDQLRSGSIHGQEHATVARKLQVLNCDDRICVRRKLSHDERVDREEIKARMKVRKMRQVDLANALGLDPDKVSKSLARNGVRTFTPDEMVIIRQLLRQDGDLPTITDFRPIPIIGQVQAGNWSEAVQRPIGTLPSPETNMPMRVFGLEVVGDSMDQYAEEGATVLVNPDDKALFPGRFYVVLNAMGETTFKQYRENPSRLVPCSNNAAHKEITLGGSETFLIVGRVIWRAARM